MYYQVGLIITTTRNAGFASVRKGLGRSLINPDHIKHFPVTQKKKKKKDNQPKIIL